MFLLIEAVYEWFMNLGAEYGVNPIIFGAIYVGAIPFFTLSVGWLVYNLRRGVSVTLPVMSASLCAMSAYIYLFFAGENLPLWVYIAVGALLMYAAWSTYQKVQNRAVDAPKEESVA